MQRLPFGRWPGTSSARCPRARPRPPLEPGRTASPRGRSGRGRPHRCPSPGSRPPSRRPATRAATSGSASPTGSAKPCRIAGKAKPASPCWTFALAKTSASGVTAGSHCASAGNRTGRAMPAGCAAKASPCAAAAPGRLAVGPTELRAAACFRGRPRPRPRARPVGLRASCPPPGAAATAALARTSANSTKQMTSATPNGRVLTPPPPPPPSPSRTLGHGAAMSSGLPQLQLLPPHRRRWGAHLAARLHRPYPSLHEQTRAGQPCWGASPPDGNEPLPPVGRHGRPRGATAFTSGCSE